MYASVSTRAEIDADYFEVGYSVGRAGDHVIDVHLMIGAYFALSPDEARRLYGALGRVLAEVDADENTRAGLCPDGCCDLPINPTCADSDVDEEVCCG